MPLIILRHGGVSSPADNASLTPQGVEAVKQTVANMPAVPLKAILTGTVKRAQETANLWSQKAGVPVSTHPELDNWDLGVYRGHHSAGATAVVKQLVAHPDMPAPGGGESANQYWGRLLPMVLPLVASDDWYGLANHSRGVMSVQSVLQGDDKGMDKAVFNEPPLVKPGGAVVVTPEGVKPISAMASTEIVHPGAS